MKFEFQLANVNKPNSSKKKNVIFSIYEGKDIPDIPDIPDIRSRQQQPFFRITAAICKGT